MRSSIKKLVVDPNNLKALRFMFKRRKMLGHGLSKTFGSTAEDYHKISDTSIQNVEM